jgi:glyoxylase-like metal-dependent hydrolase (beta-lactamase superfamily II)
MRGRGSPDRQLLRLAVAREDGSWLVGRLFTPRRDPWFATRLALGTMLLYLLVLGAGVLIAMRLVRPLRDYTVIITSEEAYPRIMEAEESLEFGEKVYGDEIRGLEEKLKTAADEEEILDIENTLIILRNLCRSDIEVIPPNMVLSGSMTIHGSNGSLMLRDMGKAHSGGDIMGVLEKNRTVFTGDLLFVGEHPFLGKGNPGNLKKILEGLLKSDMEYFIPGHGPVSGRDKISEEIEYIDSLMSLVREHIDEPNVIKVRDLPEKFHNYEGHCFKGNVDFLVRYLKSE